MMRGTHPNSLANLTRYHSARSATPAERAEGIAYARKWRIENKAKFDAIYGAEGIVALSDAATAFLAANAVSPVVSGYGQPGGSVCYRLKDLSVHRLSANDVETTPPPRWDAPERRFAV